MKAALCAPLLIAGWAFASGNKNFGVAVYATVRDVVQMNDHEDPTQTYFDGMNTKVSKAEAIWALSGNDRDRGPGTYVDAASAFFVLGVNSKLGLGNPEMVWAIVGQHFATPKNRVNHLILAMKENPNTGCDGRN